MSDDELDRAIDEVVSDMMRVEPSSRLRHRVMQGIAPPERRGWGAAPRLGAGFGALVCLALVTLLVGRELSVPRAGLLPPTSQAPSRASSASRPRPVVERNAPTEAPTGPVQNGPELQADSRRGAGGGARLIAAASFLEPDSSIVIPPLDAVEPIEVEPIVVERVTAGPIDVADIVITPLQVESVHVDSLSSLPR